VRSGIVTAVPYPIPSGREIKKEANDDSIDSTILSDAETRASKYLKKSETRYNL